MVYRGIILVLASILLCTCTNKQKSVEADYMYNEGQIFGTFYHIQYQYSKDLGQDIQEALKAVDLSLSTYKPQSVLSKINTNQTVVLDSHFIKVYNRALEISDQTDGAFDMTVTSLVNAWGFGFKAQEFPDSMKIDSLMQYVGYKNIQLVNDSVQKTHPNFMLDASAIAKGYGVDVIADLFESLNIENYLVEIGGEIRLKGQSSKKKLWTVGIDKPEEGMYNEEDRIQEIISLDSGAIATSGDYRQFYYKGDKKYSHTIDPKTGFPVSHSILSATIYANDCMSADAYATAFMVMGPKKVKEFAKQHTDLGIYIIYPKDSLENEIWMNSSFKKLIQK